jgi:hypothetical protein
MLLLQYATITKQSMRMNKLESSVLAEPYSLIVDKAILNSVQFLDVIYDMLQLQSYAQTNLYH